MFHKLCKIDDYKIANYACSICQILLRRCALCRESGVESQVTGLLMTGIQGCAEKLSHVMFKVIIILRTVWVPRDLNLFVISISKLIICYCWTFEEGLWN